MTLNPYSAQSTYRLKPLASTLMIATALSAVSAYGAQLGKTQVNSSQNEPLSATIAVSDIDANNFSAQVAGRALYQQMNLTYDVPISVTFQKTSSSSGKLVLTSSSSVKNPFADVVLVLNDNGKTNTVPKTLLLPLVKQSNSVASSASANTVSSVPQPNLPATSSNTPLSVKRTPPPTLGSVESSTNKTSSGDYNNEVLTTKQSRRILPPGATPPPPTFEIFEPPVMVSSLPQSNSTSDKKEVAKPSTSKKTNQKTAKSSAGANKQQTAKNKTNSKNTSKSKPQSAKATSPSVPLGKATYRVQRNDNLWTIASQIAQDNKMSVNEVMNQIVAYNPDSFIDGDRSKLMANSNLKLPDYEVIPSQLGIQATMKAKQASQNQSNNTSGKNPNNSAGNSSQSYAKSTKKMTSQDTDARLKLVTPSDSNMTADASGTTNAQGSGLSPEVLTQLQAARERTASRAERLQALTEQLAERTDKLKLQNQRLAELEERLRQLRQQ